MNADQSQTAAEFGRAAISVTPLARPDRADPTGREPGSAEERSRHARRLRQLRERHWTMLGISLAVIVLAFLMQTGADARVSFAGLSRFPLPELCGSRALFGVSCPGCGLTRSIIALAQGDLAASFGYHRIGWLMALAILLQLPYRTYALRELRTGIAQRSWPKWFGMLLIAALLINWLAGVLAFPVAV